MRYIAIAWLYRHRSSGRFMWKYKVQLGPGESLRFEDRQPLAEGGEVERYSIVSAQGDVTGTVQFSETATSHAPAPSQLRLLQRNAWNDTVVDLRWTG